MSRLQKSPRGDQSAFAVICVHEAPLSVYHHTSLRKVLPVHPPISTILPSGGATLLNPFLDAHGALSVTSDHVVPLSFERHTSLWPPPIRMRLPSGTTTPLKKARGDHGALAFISVQDQRVLIGMGRKVEVAHVYMYGHVGVMDAQEWS